MTTATAPLLTADEMKPAVEVTDAPVDYVKVMKVYPFSDWREVAVDISEEAAGYTSYTEWTWGPSYKAVLKESDVLRGVYPQNKDGYTDWDRVEREQERAHQAIREHFLEYLWRGIPTDALLDRYHEVDRVLVPQIKSAMPEVPNVRRRSYLTDDGEDFEVDRYVGSETEMWQRTTKTKSRKKAVTLGVNFSAAGDRGQDWFINLIVGATVFANHLINNGYAVRLLGCRMPSYGYGASTKYLGYTFPIIDYGERFDPVSALCWGHPAMVRFLGFGWNSIIYPETGDGAGSEPRLPKEVLPLMGVDHLVTANTGSPENVAQHFISNTTEFIESLWK